MSWTEEILPINTNCTKKKSYGNICSKYYHNISDEVDIQQLLSDDLKVFINCNIDKIHNKMIETDKILPTNLNYTKNKSHSNNCNSHCNSDRVGIEE